MSKTKEPSWHIMNVNEVISYCTSGDDSPISQTSQARGLAYMHDTTCDYLLKTIADAQADIESIDAESDHATESILLLKKENLLTRLVYDYKINFAKMQAAIEVHEAFKADHQQSYKLLHKPQQF